MGEAPAVHRALQLAMLERDVLERLAHGHSPREALDELVVGLERIVVPGTKASVLVVGPDGALHHGASRSLPPAFIAGIEPVAIAAESGSCGTAAFRRERVIVTDVTTDPKWKGYGDLAIEHGLRACWSEPILATSGDVLGTLAFYYSDARAPGADDVATIEGAARVARIVLEAERAQMERARQARREKALFAAARVLAEADAVAVDRALTSLLGAVGDALGWDVAAAWLRVDGESDLRCAAHWSRGDHLARFVDATKSVRLGVGDGLPGRAVATGEPQWVAIRKDDPGFPRAADALAVGLGHGCAFPIRLGAETLGAIEIFTSSRDADPASLALALGNVGFQVGSFLRRARVNADRERLLAELKETVRWSELFAGVLAHDLRNPLATMIMGSQLLAARTTDTQSNKTIARMTASGKRMARMIDQLLDITRARQGSGLALVRASEDLDALSRSVVSELHVAFPDRELVVVAEGDARGHWDHDRLAQVLSNLVGNAIQHGDVGAPIIVRVDGTDASTVHLHVHNRGTIAPQHLPSLFDPFRRAAAKGSSPGLGLGLYITKLIATAHGGDVSVTSNDETGTTFSVSLPRGAA